jgi:hypothetical protein
MLARRTQICVDCVGQQAFWRACPTALLCMGFVLHLYARVKRYPRSGLAYLDADQPPRICTPCTTLAIPMYCPCAMG